MVIVYFDRFPLSVAGEVEMGGAESAVVLFDCDYRFSLLRLTEVLEARIRAKTGSKAEIFGFWPFRILSIPS